jgi:hypothetical protein
MRYGSSLVLVALALWLCACAAEDPGSLSVRRAFGLTLAVPKDYPTIQQAVDKATWSDVVEVAAGHYTENIIHNSGVVLKGAGPGLTVLHGEIYYFGSDYATVTGFRVTASGAVGLKKNVGILANGEDFVIKGNVVEGFAAGIGAESETVGVVSNNLVRQNEVGIALDHVGFAVHVVNNQVLNNTKAGVRQTGDTSARISHNTIVGNGFAEALLSGGAGVVSKTLNAEVVRNNLIVSNNGGVNLLNAASSTYDHNLVWGNVTNYAGLAAAGAGDVSLDPTFVDAAGKDFRLRAGSPAVDAGLDLKLGGDYAGNPRPVGAKPDLGAFELQTPAQAGDLVITEVMANPVDEARGEYVELYNHTAGPLDAAGLILDDGDSTDKLLGYKGGATVVPAKGYAVILDPGYAAIAAPYTIPAGTVLLSVPNAALGSSLSTSDPIRLWRGGATISRYLHPFTPGNGISAERVDLAKPDASDNWAASPCAASPGKQNCIAGGQPGPALVITEVMASPLISTSGEFVELYNAGTQTIDLAKMALSDGDSTDLLKAAPGKSSQLAPGQRGIIIDPDLVSGMAGAPYYLGTSVPVVLTVSNTALGNGLAKNDSITIYATDGKTVLATYSHPVATTGQPVERVDLKKADLASNWIPSPCTDKHSAGLPNCASGGGSTTVPKLVISEVMANPLDEDTGEFVEIYNPTSQGIDAAGLVLADGDTTDVLKAFAGQPSAVIPAKGYAVVLDPEHVGDYTFPTGTVRLAPADTAIGNGLATTDVITLLATDGLSVVSSYISPFNPGNGISVERVVLSGADTKSNWVASTCSSGSSPGAANCSATP